MHEPKMYTGTIRLIQAERDHLARAAEPLPVVVARGEGVWVTDLEGKRYLDLSSTDGSLIFGHRHPAIVSAARAQLDRLGAASPAVRDDRAVGFAAAVAALCGKDRVLPVATPAAARAAAVDIARAWAQREKGLAEPEVIVAGPALGGGAVAVPHGDADAVIAAIGARTAAVVATTVDSDGIVIAPDGYLARLREACDRAGILLIADETRAPLGRSGSAADGGGADLYILGAALGGGVVSLGAVAGAAEVLDDIAATAWTAEPGPLATAVGTQVADMLASGEFDARAAALGAHLATSLSALVGHGLTAVRAAGVWAGVDIDPSVGTARDVAVRLTTRGVLVGDAHDQTLTFAPPVVIRATELDWAVEQLRVVLA